MSNRTSPQAPQPPEMPQHSHFGVTSDTVAPQNPPIGYALDRLDDQLSLLMQRVDSLQLALTPVMSSPAPQPPSVAEDCLDRPGDSALVQLISDHSERVREAAMRLQSIMNRLEC